MDINKPLPAVDQLILRQGQSNSPELGIAGFLDVETTGLSPYRDEVIELALALFTYHRQTGKIIAVVEQYAGLREPGRNIPAASTSVHGLTMDDVSGKQLDQDRIEQMLDKAEFLVAHNASFDRGFITKLFPKSRAKRWLCSMRGVKWREHGFASAGLQQLLRCHGIRPTHAHRAGDDVLCAIELLSCKAPDGTAYFRELLQGLNLNANTKLG